VPPDRDPSAGTERAPAGTIDVRQVSKIPIKVEAAPVQRLYGHVGIASDDKNDPEHRQGPQNRA